MMSDWYGTLYQHYDKTEWETKAVSLYYTTYEKLTLVGVFSCIRHAHNSSLIMLPS
jgi:hypothetical protein